MHACKFHEWANVHEREYRIVLLVDVVYYLTSAEDTAKLRSFGHNCEILYFYSFYNPSPHKTDHDMIREQVGCFRNKDGEEYSVCSNPKGCVEAYRHENVCLGAEGNYKSYSNGFRWFMEGRLYPDTIDIEVVKSLNIPCMNNPGIYWAHKVLEALVLVGEVDANWITLNITKLRTKDFDEPAQANTFIMVAPLLSALRYRFVNANLSKSVQLFKIILFFIHLNYFAFLFLYKFDPYTFLRLVEVSNPIWQPIFSYMLKFYSSCGVMFETFSIFTIALTPVNEETIYWSRWRSGIILGALSYLYWSALGRSVVFFIGMNLIYFIDDRVRELIPIDY